MSKIVIGLFDRLEDAQAAVHDLVNGGFRREDIRLFANDALGQLSQNTPGSTTQEGSGALVGGISGLQSTLVGAGIPEDQARNYGEGVRRGATLVSVVTPDEMALTAADMINHHNPVDMKQRISQGSELGDHWTDEPREQEIGRLRNEAVPEMHTEVPRSAQEIGLVNNEIPPLRETEVPRSEQEVGVINNELSPEIDTDLPPTHQEIGRLNNETGENGFDEYDAYFRNHYNSNFANTSFTYDQYRPYYEYGYELANDQRYRGRDWDQIEFDARTDWERSHPGARWDNFEAAVHEAWMRVTGRM